MKGFGRLNNKFRHIYFLKILSVQPLGMSKDSLIVTDWNYQCANWIYVVLSRVRTRSGLYLAKPLNMEKEFNVPASLMRFERRMREEKEMPLLERLSPDLLD